MTIPKNLTVFRLEDPPSDDLFVLSVMDGRKFQMPAPGASSSAGFVEAAPGEFVHRRGPWLHVAVQSAERKVSALALRQEAERLEKAHTEETGKPFNKAERLAVKERLLSEARSATLPTRTRIGLYANLAERRLWVDSASPKAADLALSLLREALNGLPVTRFDSQVGAPGFAQATAWASVAPHEQRHGLRLRDPVWLVNADEGSKVSAKNVSLASGSVYAALDEAFSVARIGMDFNNGDVTFGIDGKLVFRNVKFDSELLEIAEGDDAGFDAEFALFTGTMPKVVDSVAKVFGQPSGDF